MTQTSQSVLPFRSSRVLLFALVSLGEGCFQFRLPERQDAQRADADGATGDVVTDLGLDVLDRDVDAGTDTGVDTGVDTGIDASATDVANEASRDVVDVATDRPVCPPDAAAVDAASPDGSAGGFAAGNCGENNGGCSTFATCQQVAPCLRRCTCARGLTIQPDGASCAGLVLVSKTSTSMPGTNMGIRSYQPFVPNTGRYVAFVSLALPAPIPTTPLALIPTRCYVADVVTGAVREVSSVGGARPTSCRYVHVSNDGNRAIYLTRGLVPMDSPPAEFGDPSVADWVYYRDGAAAPQRLDLHQRLATRPVVQHGDGITSIAAANDGRRVVVSTRWHIDPSSTADREVNLFSASVPLEALDPLKESVNSDRTNGSEGPVGGNIFGGLFSADGTFFVFHTQKNFEGYFASGTDLFGRRLGVSVATAGSTVALAPLSGTLTPPIEHETSWEGAPNVDGSVVAFASYARARGIPLGRQRVYVAQQRAGMAPIVTDTGIESPYDIMTGRDRPEVSLSADARYMVIASSTVLTRTGETPADNNTTSDLYLFDIRTPSSPVRLGRINVPTNGSDPPPNMSDGQQSYTPRIAADGASVVFATTQALVPEDMNGETDVYLRVYR